MEIRVNIPDELAVRAESRGLPVERYVEELLSQHLPAQAQYNPPRTPEEIRAWLDSFGQFSDKGPELPESNFREWLYQDHD